MFSIVTKFCSLDRDLIKIKKSLFCGSCCISVYIPFINSSDTNLSINPLSKLYEFKMSSICDLISSLFISISSINIHVLIF